VAAVLISVIIGLVLVIVALISHQGKALPIAPSALPAQAVEAPLLTVKDVRQDMLRYNGKQVRVRAIIVDYGGGGVKRSSAQAAMFGSKAIVANLNSAIWENLDISKESGWIVADHLGDYFPGLGLPSDGGGSLMITPATPKLHYHDWVELTGTYNASANTLVLDTASVTGHYSPSAQ